MIGYHPIRPLDPKEANLRDRWYEAKTELANAGFPDSGPTRQGYTHIDDLLSRYLWDRSKAERDADRAKYPKAKRNQPFEGPQGIGRVIP